MPRRGMVCLMRPRLLVPCCLCLALTAAGQAPPGFKTYENKLARLTFFYPVAYQEIPLPPTEQVVVAKYLVQQRPEELKRVDDRLYEALTPAIEVFLFEIPTPTTGAAAADKGPSEPATVREAMEARSRVTSWSEFTQRFARWNLEELEKKPGHFELAWKEKWRGEAAPIGYLIRKQEGNSVFGVYGYTLSPHKRTFEGHLAKIASGLALADGDTGETAEAAIDKLYASGKYRAVPWRKKARSELAKGWKAVDTDNFLIVHHSKNLALVNQIAREIEAMRALYAELFPAVNKVDSVSVVRICRTKDEYHQYGGPPNTGGYWHPGNEELVFYDYSYTMKTLDRDERRALGDRVLTDEDSLLVLYHEALHQYMHYAIGEFSPHDWFNEGYGDYFSGAVLADTTSRVLRIDPSPWRIHLAKDMCEYGEGFVPLDKLLKAERAEFYNPARARHYYAAAWSFVFFLKNAKEVAGNPQWSKLLQVYFDTVKSAYRTEIDKAGAAPDLAGKQVAGFQARKVALAKATEGIDLAQLEAAWRKWVVDMKDPWPSQRKKRK